MVEDSNRRIFNIEEHIGAVFSEVLQ